MNQQLLEAVAVLTAAETSNAMGKDLVGQLVDEHRGPELIFGLIESARQLLYWLSEVSDVPTDELLSRLAATASPTS